MTKKKKKTTHVKKVTPVKKIVPDNIKKTKIRVIGIGGGGGNIVSDIASKITKASFVVANTDTKSLKGCAKKAVKFQFGQNLTFGLGTGMNPELAKEAAQNEKDKIKKLLEGYDLTVLVASLGGGTGSGAVATFAKISKDLGNLTYGIFTLPFEFEGEKKMEIALNALKEVRPYFNIISIIPNERVFRVISKETPLREALAMVNKFLTESLGGLIETIYEPGLINIDFADFRTILEGRGRLAYLNTFEARKKGADIENLIEQALSSPFYPYSIKGAKGVLFNIVGEKDLSLFEVNKISETIVGLTNSEAKIIFGIAQAKKNAPKIKTILLATGCGLSGEIRMTPPKEKVKKVKKKKTPKVEEKKEEVKKEKKVVKKVKKEEPKVAVAPVEEKVRKNALQIKKEVEEIEREMRERESFWDTPAFLRKKT